MLTLVLAVSAQLGMASLGNETAAATVTMQTRLSDTPGIAPWSWDTMSTFVHCSNMSGPLNTEIVALMARSSFTVLEKYQCLFCAPNQTGAEGKVLAAAERHEQQPQRTYHFYFAVDHTRRWYDEVHLTPSPNSKCTTKMHR